MRTSEVEPEDGTVIDGKSAVNELAVTGKSMACSKRPGVKIIGGILNGTGSLIMRAAMVPAKIVA